MPPPINIALGRGRLRRHSGAWALMTCNLGVPNWLAFLTIVAALSTSSSIAMANERGLRRIIQYQQAEPAPTSHGDFQDKAAKPIMLWL